jgi:hypothetical protein
VKGFIRVIHQGVKQSLCHHWLGPFHHSVLRERFRLRRDETSLMLGGLVGLRERPTTSERPSLPTASGGKSERKMRTVGAVAKRTLDRWRATETQLRGSGHLPRATSTKDWAGLPLENSCWVVLNIPDLELRKDDEEVADVLASGAGSSMPSPSSSSPEHLASFCRRSTWPPLS